MSFQTDTFSGELPKRSVFLFQEDFVEKRKKKITWRHGVQQFYLLGICIFCNFHLSDQDIYNLLIEILQYSVFKISMHYLKLQNMKNVVLTFT